MAFAWHQSAEPAYAEEVTPKANPSSTDLSKAKRHMKAGVAFMKDPDGARYEEAYPEFKKAYQLSGSLNALNNLAICAMQLELDGEAIDYYQIVLNRKGKRLDPRDRKQIESDLSRLKATVAWVTMTASEDDVTVEDVRTPTRGFPIRNQYKVGLKQKIYGIHPGKHTFIATNAAGKTSEPWKVTIRNGGKLNHEFTFDTEPAGGAGGAGAGVPITGGDGPGGAGAGPGAGGDGAEDSGSNLPISGFVMGGVTVASAITWGALAAVASSRNSDYEDNILGKAPEPEQREARDEITTLNIAADVMLGVTAAAAVTTVVLFIVNPEADSADDTAARGGARQPKVGVDYSVVPTIDPRGESAGAAFTA
ncbi:MAG: hypothetical protein AAGA56_16995, partial [Myxococcota bacterium]